MKFWRGFKLTALYNNILSDRMNILFCGALKGIKFEHIVFRMRNTVTGVSMTGPWPVPSQRGPVNGWVGGIPTFLPRVAEDVHR